MGELTVNKRGATEDIEESSFRVAAGDHLVLLAGWCRIGAGESSGREDHGEGSDDGCELHFG